MLCPKCNTELEMYERFWNYDDGETLVGQEHYICKECETTYSKDVTYTLIKEGELKE